MSVVVPQSLCKDMLVQTHSSDIGTGGCVQQGGRPRPAQVGGGPRPADIGGRPRPADIGGGQRQADIGGGPRPSLSILP